MKQPIIEKLTLPKNTLELPKTIGLRQVLYIEKTTEHKAYFLFCVGTTLAGTTSGATL